MDFNNINFHSKSAAEAHKAVMMAVVASMFAPVVTTTESAKKMAEDLQSENLELRKKASMQFAKAVAAPFDVFAGRENEIVSRAKTITNTVLPLNAQQVVFLQQNVDSRDLDMGWTQWMAQDNASGALSLMISDAIGLGEWVDLAGETSDVPLDDLLAGAWEQIGREWNGKAHRIAKSILAIDPLQTINNVAIIMRFNAMAKMNRDMYTATQAGITAANSASYTTAFATNVAHTVNLARIALFARAAALGIGQEFSMNSPVVLVANEAFRDVIEPFFVPLINQISVTYGTPMPMYPITRIYSFKLATDLGISGSKAALIMPFRKNRVGIFQSAMIESVPQPLNNAVTFVGRQSYNTTVEEKQFQILSLA